MCPKQLIKAMCPVRAAAVQRRPVLNFRAAEVCPKGPSSLVRGAGLSQRPVIWHGGEERVPKLTVDEKHDEQHQQEEQEAHNYVGD